mmetsp:Transcript_19029/g.39991  ORF Transcript_19029/g.39991 Transcript_19029/m.39991 type:complete len:247 (+) Transcript_19029:155-895(+)
MTAAKASPPQRRPFSPLNIGTATALFLVLTTSFFLSLSPSNSLSLPATSLLVFNNINIFVALNEIVLGRHISLIQSDYRKFLIRYKGNEWGAVVDFLTMPLKLSQLFDGRIWSKMWSTYSLYDPSYQNHESFGFFIDFGNGMSTIPPTLLMNFAMVSPESSAASGILSPLVVGCVCIAMYWQVMYGTIIYVLSFMFNRRYEGKTALEVALFVGFSNSLWFFWPILAIYYCVCILRDGTLDVFGGSG